ncbi:MAG TPA: helix-turn-helix domain-containing protein [Nitrosopumilaceae archaeon]|nr:helix-turn-helix domain-containing protein [Nitrosopumilaceae archaeon]
MKLIDNNIQIGVFASADDDSNLQEHQMRLEKIKNELLKYGLTSNQAKVFIFLGKHGPKSGPEVSKSLNIIRTEAYQILHALEGKGIITAKFSSPTKYVPLPFEQAISSLINTEKEKINTLAKEEDNLTELWKKIPAYTVETNEIENERLQMLEGAAPIYSKIKSMIKNAEKRITILGSEKDIARFHYADIFETISDSLTDVRIILSPSTALPNFLARFDKKKIRLMSVEKTGNRCFIIKDDNEAILFLRNATHNSDNVFAIWSNSKSLTDSIRTLFDYSWASSKIC